MTDKHAAEYSKAVFWDVINVCEMQKLFIHQNSQKYRTLLDKIAIFVCTGKFSYKSFCDRRPLNISEKGHLQLINIAGNFAVSKLLKGAKQAKDYSYQFRKYEKEGDANTAIKDFYSIKPEKRKIMNIGIELKSKPVIPQNLYYLIQNKLKIRRGVDANRNVKGCPRKVKDKQ